MAQTVHNKVRHLIERGNVVQEELAALRKVQKDGELDLDQQVNYAFLEYEEHHIRTEVYKLLEEHFNRAE